MAFEPEAYLGPFHRLLGVDVERAEAGEAVLGLPLEQHLSSRDETTVAQGGAVFTLADVCGGLALLSATEAVASPTIDMRIDYLEPAVRDLRAVGEVLRVGGQTGVADVDVRDERDRLVARARGVYKLQFPTTDSPWTRGEPTET